MLSNFNDIKTDVIVKLGITTTSAYYTDAILDDWIQQAERWATSYKKWAFTEGRVSTTWAGTEELTFEGYKADSFRYLKVGDKVFQKLNFEDYLIMKEETPNANDRVYTDYGRLVMVNPKADASGTLTAYGQYTPLPIDVTDLTATTVFSGGDEEGNTAIVQEVLSYAFTRKEEPALVKFHHENAVAILDSIKGIIDDEQFNYHSHKTRGGMWERVDVIDGGLRDELFKRDQF